MDEVEEEEEEGEGGAVGTKIKTSCWSGGATSSSSFTGDG